MSIFGRKRAPQFIVIQLNARLQPFDRGDLFEDRIDAALKKAGLGEVTGGGTQLADLGEVDWCDVEVQVRQSSAAVIQLLLSTLNEIGAPKGSKLHVPDPGDDIEFGTLEGLAVYLNGTELPADVYKTCDSNFVYAEFNRLLEGEGRVWSHWQGPTETALYMYGGSFTEMKRRLEPFLASYPLCQKCRVVQIA